VTWLRLRYTKLGAARFTSARDVARLMERAFKRAGVPVAYSSGFSPHQRVSYAFPAPTGAASLAEYVLVGLTSMAEASELAAALGSQLPGGVRIEGAEMTADRHLPAQLAASLWRVDWPDGASTDLAEDVNRFMASQTVVIERKAKSGTSQQDVRGAVVQMTADSQAGGGQGASMTVVLRQAEPLIRPTDVTTGLGECWGRGMLTRLAQGNLVGGGVVNVV